MEAAGVVVDVGDGVPAFCPATASPTPARRPGAYCSVRTLPAAQVVLLPDDVDDETAAALMLKGITADYLLHDARRVGPATRVLVHAAAGGVGLLVCQWARALGRPVVGTVSTEAKARARARARLRASSIVTRELSLRRAVAAGQRRPWCRRDLRRPRATRRRREPRRARPARPLDQLRPGERSVDPSAAWARSRGPSLSRSSFTTPRTPCNRWRATCSRRCVTAS